MTVVVEFHSPKTTGMNPYSATVTLIPNWLERLFGVRKRTGRVHRMKRDAHHVVGRSNYVWVWTTTERSVEDYVTDAIEAHEVSDLPHAEVVRDQ